MDFFNAIGEYAFLRNALAAALLSGISCGIVGSYIVARRMVFMGGGITHASFGGIGAAYHFGLNPIGGALVFAVLSALGIEWGAAKGRIREDSAIGIVWSLGMAIGIVFIFLTPGYAPNLMGFLFGDILTVTRANIAASAVLTAVLIVVMLLWSRPIAYAAFDREYAKSQGVAANLISTGMTVLSAAAIVLSIRIVGIVLLMSLVTIPPVIAGLYTKSYNGITFWSAALAAVGNFFGIWAAYEIDFPVGATTIILLAFTLLIVKLLTLCRRKKSASR